MDTRFKNRGCQPAVVSGCLTLIVALGLSLACSRSESLQQNSSSPPPAAQKLPFHPGTDQAGAGDGTLAAVTTDPKHAGRSAFASHTRTLPTGTLLTVQLEDSLSTAKVHDGDVFSASIAAPLMIDGETVLRAGAVVTGRVESARSLAGHPGLVHDAGYFRLTLSSVNVDGRQVVLQTASLFARGTFRASYGVAVRRGHRLTFRLTAPVTLDTSNAVAKR